MGFRERTGMNTGQIVSAAGHVTVFLWIMFGDWLFQPKDMPEVTVAEVSLMTSSEFDEMVAAAPAAAPEQPAEAKPETPAEQPAEPVKPAETEPPVVEDIPEDVPVSDAPQPIEAPEPVAPLADTEQPVPVAPSDVKPKPRPVDRVAAVPVENTEDAPEIADTVTPKASEDAAPDAPVIEEQPEAAPEEATTQIVTEAVETEDNAPQLPKTASLPPRSRPKDLVKPEEPPQEDVAAAEPTPEPEAATDTDADAIAAAVAAAASEAPAEEAPAESTDTGAATGESNAPSGPPMTGAETDAMRVAVQACWNVGALSMEALRTTVVVGVSVKQDGKPDSASVRLVSSEGGSDVSTAQAFEAARRAIIRCGSKGFPLPPEKYDQWKELELVFDPNGMRMR